MSKKHGPRTTRANNAFGATKSYNKDTGKTGFGSTAAKADKARQQKEKQAKRHK